MNKYSRVKAEIDLGAISSNIEELHKNLPEGTQVMGIIKADGYGHGCVSIGRVLEKIPYIWGYGVATADEALELKAVPLHKPILILGCVFPDQYEQMIMNDVRFNIYNIEMAVKINECAKKLGKKALAHIKIDTGMSRLGFSCRRESVDEIEAVCRMDHIEAEGIFTHFSKADEEDKTFTHGQIRRFDQMIADLKERGIVFPLVHASNSAGIIDFHDLPYPLVRAGIAMYGLEPSPCVDLSDTRLTPVLSLKSHVIMVKTIEPGASVSYGGFFTAEKKMRIATIPVGYADGYPRSLSNKGMVLIRGRKAPVIGRICMDQFMVDVSEIPDAAFGDEVTLVGRDGDEVITVEQLAQLSGRFNYEFVCDLSKRIPRVFYENGRAVASLDFFGI